MVVLLVVASLRTFAAEVVETVQWPIRTSSSVAEGVTGELRIPAEGRKPLPAVIILTSSPGFDGRGADYARELNRAGIATLELDMFQGRGVPKSPRDNLPHVFQSLSQLKKDGRIDGSRIGVMGFSWGGSVALLAGFPALTPHSSEAVFAAHLPLYPICWLFDDAARGRADRWWKDLGRTSFTATTGRPVHILAGERDVVDVSGACAQFLAALPPEVRRSFSLTVYPQATFAWDSRFSSANYMRGVARGRGGIATIDADPAIAAQSRAFAVDYFKRYLQP